MGQIKLKSVITFIANLSISTNEVLTELKQVRVRPIYKKDDRLWVSNYRHVSILNIVSKFLELAICCSTGYFI